MAGPYREQVDDSVPYFAISRAKLLCLSVATSGLYDLYWFYASWRQIGRRTGQRKQPFAQALVLWVSFFRLGDRLNRSLRNQGIRRAYVGVLLPISYLVLRLFAGASTSVGLVSLGAAVPLIFFQEEARRWNQAHGLDPYIRGWTRWEVLVLVVLGPLTLFGVLADAATR